MSWQPDIRLRDKSGRSPQSLLVELHAPLVVALLALQGALALLLAARALSGPASDIAATSSAAGGLLVWSVVAAMLAALARLCWFANVSQANPTLDATARYLPLAAVAITAASVPLAGAGWAVTAAAWLVLAIEELVVLAALPGGRVADRWLMFRRAWPDALRRGARQRSSVRRPSTGDSTTPISTARATITPDPLAPESPCVQRLSRVQEIDGADLLEGSLSTCFAAGQTTSQIHVAFCPSFARVPTLDYRQSAGPQARVKLGQLLPHGARFDVKLSGPASRPLQVTLEIVARHAPVHADAPAPAPGESGERSTSAPL